MKIVLNQAEMTRLMQEYAARTMRSTFDRNGPFIAGGEPEIESKVRYSGDCTDGSLSITIECEPPPRK